MMSPSVSVPIFLFVLLKSAVPCICPFLLAAVLQLTDYPSLYIPSCVCVLVGFLPFQSCELPSSPLPCRLSITFVFIIKMGCKNTKCCSASGSSFNPNLTIQSDHLAPAEQNEEPKMMSLLQWLIWQAAKNSSPTEVSPSAGMCPASSFPEDVRPAAIVIFPGPLLFRNLMH